MLNNSFSFGHILLGSVLALTIPLICAPLALPTAKIKRPFKFITYILLVLKDIVVANVQVAILVIGPMRNIKPGFIAIPLDMKDTFAITILASTVTMTPGTVSCELSEDREWLYVHVLDMPDDEQEVINFIKQRYEARVKEIFGC